MAKDIFTARLWAKDYLALQKFKKSTILWKFEQAIKAMVPKRPLKKIPFEKRVIDSENSVFEYEIIDRKPVYRFIFQVYEIKLKNN